MSLVLEPWTAQTARWPREGRHLLAQFDDASVVVYQAYRPEIARWAVEHGRLGGEGFSLARMSWIKPSFLWMMFRSGWATKPDQEAVLAVRLRRTDFEALLLAAVPSGLDPARYASEQAWQADVARSDVRLQWDPDHHPSGSPTARRAIQLGLRRAALRRYVAEALSIEDVTDLVRAQRAHAEARAWDRLVTPREEVYPVGREAAASLGM